jgi:tetratricopeptide (TPR) repeat protein
MHEPGMSRRGLKIATLLFALMIARGAHAQDAATLRAQLALAEKAEDKASVVEIARRWLAAAPDDARALRRLIEASLAVDEAKRAVAVLDAAAKRPALASAVVELRGDVAAANGKPAAAYAAWKQALGAAGDPSRRAIIWRKIAALGTNSNHFEWTVEALRNLPASADAKGQLAVALLQRGEFDAAIVEMQAANRLDASAPNVKSSLPRFEALQRQLPAIQPVLARLKTNPRDIDALAERAAWLALYGANVAALADANAAANLDPSAKGVLVLRGYLLRKLGRTAEAEELRVAAITDEARFLNRLLPVLRVTDAAIRAKPDAAAQARRAANLLAANQPLLAFEEASAALKLDPKSGSGALVAGQASSQLGHRAEAMRFAKLATENNPRDPEAWEFLAQLQRRRAELALAIGSFSEAITLNPKDADLFRARETCLRTLGRDSEADRDREAWMRLRPAAPTEPKPKISDSNSSR